MMKKGFTYSFIIVLSLLFFYAACGYNVIKYCCSSCEKEGVEMLVSAHCADAHEQSCCADDHSAPISDSETCALDYTSTNDACQLVHLKVDEAVFQSASVLEQVKLFSSLLFDVSQKLFQAAPLSFLITIPPPDKPLLLSGQKILSLICVLRR
jgi:hypothetical protein